MQLIHTCINPYKNPWRTELPVSERLALICILGTFQQQRYRSPTPNTSCIVRLSFSAEHVQEFTDLSCPCGLGVASRLPNQRYKCFESVILAADLDLEPSQKTKMDLRLIRSWPVLLILYLSWGRLVTYHAIRFQAGRGFRSLQFPYASLLAIECLYTDLHKYCGVPIQP